jgi:hypothetical protein
MVCTHVFDQAVYCPADRIDIPALATDCTRILAVWSVALDDKALCETELPRLHDIGLVSGRFVEDGDGCSFPYHPKVFAGNVEANAACRTSAAASRGKASCQGVSGHVLEIESISAEELFWAVHDGTRRAL